MPQRNLANNFTKPFEQFLRIKKKNNSKQVKFVVSILFVAFLTCLPCTGEVYSVFKPKQKSKTSCTVFRGKYTVADQIEYRYGVILGQNIATIKSKKGNSQDVITGLMGGLAMQVVWPQGYAIQPEILYSQKGCMTTGSGIRFDMDYLEVPVKFMYRLHLADIKPFAFVAPYGAYAIKLTTQGESISDDTPSDQINKFDAGIGAGAGFDIWNVQLSFKYSWGFAQVLNEASPIRNKVFTVSVAVLF